MTLRVVGAGLGRTGTNSLKLALERLLGGPCYHMFEVFQHLDDHVPMWHAAARGDDVDWDHLFDGYVAAVDWPASAYWSALADTFPDALILLSRRSAASWWRSASTTIFPAIETMAGSPWHAMVTDMMATTFTPDFDDRDAAMAAFEAHNARVLAEAPADRLLVWEATDGWETLCAALGVAVPDESFPKTNTTEEFLARRDR
jgi:hypothetical protein